MNTFGANTVKALTSCCLLSLIATALSGCTGVRLHESPKHSTTVTEPPAEPKFGLALSGGGIRSGAVSLGVLQTLQASNVLLEFDYVSTVSGGGYPVYGLLFQLIQDKETTLNQLLGEQSAFVANAEAEASFIPNVEYFGSVLISPLWGILTFPFDSYGSGQPTYGAKIHRTFAGGSRPLFFNPTIEKAVVARRRGFPIPIFGTSASFGMKAPQARYVYTMGDYFEISPGMSGSPNIGYFTNAFDDLELVRAITTSAAAIDAPQGGFQLPFVMKAMNFGLGSKFSYPTENKTNQHIYLADGGFVENMGILPLLRRGCTDILAVDNSADTTLFDAWFKFERDLPAQESGWTVIESLRSIPTQISPTTNKCDHWKLPSHIWSARLKNGVKEVRIVYVKLGINSEQLERYPPEVTRYALTNWSALSKTNWTNGIPLQCEKTGVINHCPFPVESTVDQSYTPEEFRAYRLLGKWLAKEAIPHLRRTPDEQGAH